MRVHLSIHHTLNSTCGSNWGNSRCMCQVTQTTEHSQYTSNTQPHLFYTPFHLHTHKPCVIEFMRVGGVRDFSSPQCCSPGPSDLPRWPVWFSPLTLPSDRLILSGLHFPALSPFFPTSSSWFGLFTVLELASIHGGRADWANTKRTDERQRCDKQRGRRKRTGNMKRERGRRNRKTKK